MSGDYRCLGSNLLWNGEYVDYAATQSEHQKQVFAAMLRDNKVVTKVNLKDVLGKTCPNLPL